jgi:Ca-activated chloride channel family protein
VIFGKWRGEATGRIVVTGKNGENEFRAELPVGAAVKVDSPDALAHLWARRRLEQLDENAPGTERDEAMVALGLKYHLLTRLTSFVAVDEVVRRAVPTLKTIQQPLPLPQGVENTAVGGPVPTSPEPETLGLVVVTVLVAAAAYWRRRIRKTNASLL